MARRAPNARRWTFTINNYSDDELSALQFITERLSDGSMEHLRGPYEKWSNCKAIIFEKEVGEQGTPHIQGYFEMNARITLPSLKQLPPLERAHLEVARGTRPDNYAYCSKTGDDVYEWHASDVDIDANRDTRNQWDIIKRMIIDHSSFNEIRDAYPETALRYESGLRKWIHESCQEELQEYDGSLKEKNLWIYGDAGIGKSRWCWDQQGSKYNKPCNKWWDGYDNESIVIIEDMDPTKASMLSHHLKIWGDRYPFTAEIKGGALAVQPTYKLYVTSNYSPDECFQNPQDLAAIRRRFKVVHWVSLNGVTQQLTE